MEAEWLVVERVAAETLVEEAVEMVAALEEA